MGDLVSFFFYAKIVALALLCAVLLWVVPLCVVYGWFFRRVHRPDYAVTAGEYCYDRVKGKHPRTEFLYRAGRSVLKGYYYGCKDSKKLIVLSHGFRSGADDFLPLICALRERGYSVFSYDGTGTYDSKGRTLVGMCQALVDLDHTLSFLAREAQFRHEELYLVGHSLGGYAALSALRLHPEVKACVALAPVRDGTALMTETAELFVGKLALVGKPVFSVLQRLSFGKYTEYNSVDGINSSRIPILIVQGKDDEILTYRKTSLCACKDRLKSPNLSFWVIEGESASHSGLWHSEAAVRYKAAVDEDYRKFYKRRHRRPDWSERAAYFARVNNALYSEVSQPLVERIDQTFSTANEA